MWNKVQQADEAEECYEDKMHDGGNGIFIYPIAIAYSMGQIIKSVCVCQCCCLTVAFRDRFSPKLAQT